MEFSIYNFYITKLRFDESYESFWSLFVIKFYLNGISIKRNLYLMNKMCIPSNSLNSIIINSIDGL